MLFLFHLAKHMLLAAKLVNRQRQNLQAAHWYQYRRRRRSIYLLYWYKTTNTDADKLRSALSSVYGHTQQYADARYTGE
jgi:hypothetical protein